MNKHTYADRIKKCRKRLIFSSDMSVQKRLYCKATMVELLMRLALIDLFATIRRTHDHLKINVSVWAKPFQFCPSEFCIPNSWYLNRQI